jgi:hypothetical protein
MSGDLLEGTSLAGFASDLPGMQAFQARRSPGTYLDRIARLVAVLGNCQHVRAESARRSERTVDNLLRLSPTLGR